MSKVLIAVLGVLVLGTLWYAVFTSPVTNNPVRPAQPSSATFTPPATGHSVQNFKVSESADGRVYTCTETVAGGQVYINDCETP